MAKKKKRPPKSGPVWVLSSVEATLLQMPQYNAHVVGHGAHENKRKYNRKNKSWRKEIQ